jgi:hypothetical protein
MRARLRRRELLRVIGAGGALLAAALAGRNCQRETGSTMPETDIPEMGDKSMQKPGETTHIVLLGDSILDNGAYVARGQAAIDHLQRVVPPGWQSTLLAVDGSITSGVERQLGRVPAGATHLVLSIGGNDALGYMGILEERAASATQVIGRLADIQDEFAARYAAMLRSVLGRGLPTILCTVYNPRFPDATMQRLAVTAAAVFNDVILRSAFAAGLPVLDLRLIFDDDADYANAIEPSSQGGAKIAAAIVRAVQEHNFTGQRSTIFV